MQTSQNGRQLIENYEGLILGAYDDADDHIVPAGGSARGTLTIGYGHTSAAGPPKVYVGQRITKDQADQILAADLQKVEASVSQLVKVPINQNQFDALVSFQFNTGSLGRSTVLRQLNAGNIQAAANGFDLYTRGRVNGQLVPMSGLVRRRRDEKALFLKPASTVPVEHSAVGGIAAAGIGLAVYLQDHIWYIVGGAALAAILTYIIIKAIKKGK